MLVTVVATEPRLSEYVLLFSVSAVKTPSRSIIPSASALVWHVSSTLSVKEGKVIPGTVNMLYSAASGSSTVSTALSTLLYAESEMACCPASPIL